MKCSSDRILTTHVGSLPRPPQLAAMITTGDSLDEGDQREIFEALAVSAVEDVVAKQVAAGIDIVSDGETSTAETRIRRRHLRYVVLVFAALLVLVLGLTVFASLRLSGQIQTDDAFDDILGDRPEQYVDPDGGKPVNILLLGEDSREGQSYVKGNGGGVSDTTILLHISADRERAYGVSVPRDLMVDRPACKDARLRIEASRVRIAASVDICDTERRLAMKRPPKRARSVPALAANLRHRARIRHVSSIDPPKAARI